MINLADELWICKPVSLNQGKGIYLVRSPEILRQKLELNDDGQQRRFGIRKPHGRIIQKHVHFDTKIVLPVVQTKQMNTILIVSCLFNNQIYFKSSADQQEEVRHTLLHAYREHQAATRLLPPRLPAPLYERVRQQGQQPHHSSYEPSMEQDWHCLFVFVCLFASSLPTSFISQMLVCVCLCLVLSKKGPPIQGH